MTTEADAVWNRACLERGGTHPREGDVALAAALLVHGLVMNGGVLHAVGVTKGEVIAASAGFRYFGFEAVASLLANAGFHAEAGSETEDWGLRLDSDYAAAIPNDGVLVAAFTRHFRSNESSYAPVSLPDDGR